MSRIPFLLTAVLFANLMVDNLSAESSRPNKHSDYFVYVGTYDKGVFAYTFNTQTGELQSKGFVGDVVNPSFLASDTKYQFLFAVSELEGKENGGVASFSIDRSTGALKALNSVSSEGTAPCHLAVDHTGKMVIVANYGSGAVSAFPVGQDGRLGKASSVMTPQGSSVDPQRQKGPHAHEVVISADNYTAYVPDLGLDQIRLYKLDPGHATMTPLDPPAIKIEPGHGPRHIAFSHNGKFLYVVNELKSVVTVLSAAGGNNWKQVQDVSTLSPDFSGENGPAEIEIDHSGEFLYASNRGPGTIAVFAIDPHDGTLKMVQSVQTAGTWPRGFQLDPTGHFLFAGDQKANKLLVFEVNQSNGQLTPKGQAIDSPSPVSFLFVPQS